MTPPLIIIRRQGLEAPPTGLQQTGRENEEAAPFHNDITIAELKARSFGRLCFSCSAKVSLGLPSSLQTLKAFLFKRKNAGMAEAPDSPSETDLDFLHKRNEQNVCR